MMHSKLLNSRKQPYQGHKQLVLIVDNDRDNLLFASYVIESLGMTGVVTDDGEQCLNLVSELSPDLILLDIVMPKIDGLEITRKIKQNKKICHIPIIAVTGLTRPEDTSKIMNAGCNDYISKPYLIEDLEAKIYSCLKCFLV